MSTLRLTSFETLYDKENAVIMTAFAIHYTLFLPSWLSFPLVYKLNSNHTAFSAILPCGSALTDAMQQFHTELTPLLMRSGSAPSASRLHIA